MSMTGVPFRRLRLSHGWEPAELCARIKFHADRYGVPVAPVWVLAQRVFLWENHREQIPPLYAVLLSEVFPSDPVDGDRAGA
jgi:hypothetical protein